MTDEIVIENLEQVIEVLTKHLEGAAAAAMGAVNVTALLVETETKKRCPVGTPESTGKPGYVGGRLRSSYHTTPASDPDNIEATVGTDVEYSGYVELGTYKMAARPHLYPAFIQETAKLEDRLTAALNKAL